jgi:hypothetical protein
MLVLATDLPCHANLLCVRRQPFMGEVDEINSMEDRTMRQFVGISVVVASQVLIAGIMANDFHRTGSGASLFLAVLCGFVAVLAAVAGYVGRNNPPAPKSDPRALRKVAWLGCAIGAPALAALLWRVLGAETSPAEQVNLWLALICIVGLGYGLPAAVALKLRRQT